MPIVVDPSAPSQTFAELQTEFYARGFDYLQGSAAGQVRAKRWINEAYKEICELAMWPFCEGDISGVAPLTITDLRKVLSVTTDSDCWLTYVGRGTLINQFGTLDTTGIPQWFYLEGSILKTYPVDTSVNLSVHYLGIPDDLSADSDKPVVPNAYQHLIIDGAVIRGYKDSDNFEGLNALRADWQSGVQRLMDSYLSRSLGNSDTIRIVAGSEDDSGWFPAYVSSG